ncbi:IclR family transcriptional regulator [Natronosalvus caseinilyticus]|uniref:IclR family transcriptional regulator n=1 Tax=Natronosalvus caseinilyticus TaxID=2953747 RepID=UPI0028AABE24|nr:IclR family transcriptional regulator [Natronosalvus caseinilyticus]
MAKDNTGTPTIKAVETSHAVIKVLQELGQATVTEVSTHTDVSKGGVFKHLKTLQESGFVVREDNEYRLGLRFLDIGGQLRYTHPGSQIIKDKMQELAEETNETSIYTVLDDTRTTTLFRETGSRGVSTRTRIGKRLYPHETAAGKTILSQLSEEEVERIIDDVGLPAVTKNTITDRAEFLDELHVVREQGYAFNLGESVEGLIAMAVPLVPDGEVLGACSVTGPYHRMKGDPVNEDISETLLSFVNELELNIAHS